MSVCIYPKAGAKNEKYIVEEILPVVWEAAAKELEHATNLYTKTEGDLSNEIEMLKKEYEKPADENDQTEK